MTDIRVSPNVTGLKGPTDERPTGVVNPSKLSISGQISTPSAGVVARPEVTPSFESIKDELWQSVQDANRRLEAHNQRLDIALDSSTGVIVVKVTDSATGETLRQIPTEEALRITRSIDSLTGILVDHRE